jgi:uridine phosphorylase
VTSLRLVAAGSNKRFRVHYFAGTVDVTTAVVGAVSIGDPERVDRVAAIVTARR